MRNRILPEFQDFLLSRSLVPAKNAPFYEIPPHPTLAYRQAGSPASRCDSKPRGEGEEMERKG
jgi:hypothetical protein